MSKKAIRNQWRELGGSLSIYYRLDRHGFIEMKGKLQSAQQIQKMCQELEIQLMREWELHAAWKTQKHTEMRHQKQLFNQQNHRQKKALGLSRIPELKPDRDRRSKKQRAS